ELATLTAITKERLPSPGAIAPGYPACLERVCLRALAKAPSERYATAAEMRRELLAAIREIAPSEPLEEALARTSNAPFPERIAEKRELIRSVRAGIEPAHIPPAEVDTGVAIPTVGDATGTDSVVVSSVEARSRSPVRPGLVSIAIGAAAVAVLGGA